MGTLQEYPQRTSSSRFKEKQVHLTKWHALTLGLVLLVIVQALFSGFLLANPRNDSASSYYEEEYLLLQSQLENLKEQYDNLSSEYVSLKASYDALDFSYDSLNSQKLSLQANYDSLESARAESSQSASTTLWRR